MYPQKSLSVFSLTILLGLFSFFCAGSKMVLAQEKDLILSNLWEFPTGKSVSILSSSTFPQTDSRITLAIIVIHGIERQAPSGLSRLVRAARMENREAETLVVAPAFLTAGDKRLSNQHFWSSSGWSEGNLSQDSELKTRRLSSFEVVDRIYRELIAPGRYPGLKRIAVVGHSAGGQFVNRYAACGQAESNQERGVEVVFVCANPSSYLYLDKRRPLAGREEFAIPSEAQFPRFNRWKYGLDKLNDYAKRSGEMQIQDNLMNRQVVYLVGSRDNSNDENLSTNPAAMIQGANRFERWNNYRRYVQMFPVWTKSSRFVPVEGVTHDATGMFLSAAGRAAIFDNS